MDKTLKVAFDTDNMEISMSSQGLKEEAKVKEILQKKFGKLTKQKLPVGQIFKEYDLVSTDRQVVIEVKSYIHRNDRAKKNGYVTTRKHRLMSACTYLRAVDCKRKILALTDTQLYMQFKMDMDMEGQFPDIEIMFVDTTQQEESSVKEVLMLEKFAKAPNKTLRTLFESDSKEGGEIVIEKDNTVRSLFRNYDYMPDEVRRKLDIYTQCKKEGFKTSDLARKYNVSSSAINNHCNSIEHSLKRSANSESPEFFFEMSLLAIAMLARPLRQVFGNELKATPEKVSRLDPLELKKGSGIGIKNLKQTKEILLRYNVQHLMHPNWDCI
ncbi:MAG: hypothetical protein IT362_11195 [Deltaproteobacteria bacterium]|nr:hypothetical protein [Deltaproteobacteria bacterium]